MMKKSEGERRGWVNLEKLGWQASHILELDLGSMMGHGALSQET